VEGEWLTSARDMFNKGFPKSAYCGSCALVTVAHNDKLYIANAGDSKAVLLRQKGENGYEPINLSTTFNANKDYEQARLKKLYPDE